MVVERFVYMLFKATIVRIPHQLPPTKVTSRHRRMNMSPLALCAHDACSHTSCTWYALGVACGSIGNGPVAVIMAE